MSKICKRCNITYANHAHVCFNCGGKLSKGKVEKLQDKEFSNKKRHPMLDALIFVIILGIAITYMNKANDNNISENTNQSTSKSTQTSVQSQSEEKKKVEEYLKQFDWHDNNFGVKIDSTVNQYGIATLKGRTISLKNKNYSYVQIEIGLYSQNGSKIGSALSNINSLNSGVTWQFEAVGTVSSNGNFKYKVENVTGW